jgi:hypothetical protein
VVLGKPLCAHQETEFLQQGSQVCRRLHLFLSPQPHNTHRDVAEFFAARGHLRLLAMLLTALPASPSSEPCAAEACALAFCRAWPVKSVSMAPYAWSLLCVPALWQRTTTLSPRRHIIASLALSGLAELQKPLPEALADVALQLSVSPEDSLTSRARQCGLHLLSGLVSGIKAPLSSRQALAFLSASRVIVAFMPGPLQQSLLKDSVKALSQGCSSLVVLRSSWLQSSTSACQEGVSTDVFSSSSWYLPPVQLENGERYRTRGTAPCGTVAAHQGVANAQAFERVIFESSLARPDLLLAVAEGLLGNRTRSSIPGDSEVGHELFMIGPHSLAQWLFMLLAVCSSDEIVRQQLETAWASCTRPIVTLLWRRVLRPALKDNKLKSFSACEGESAPLWVLPLAALCSFYSHFVSTHPDDQVFSEGVRCCRRILRVRDNHRDCMSYSHSTSSAGLLCFKQKKLSVVAIASRDARCAGLHCRFAAHRPLCP